MQPFSEDVSNATLCFENQQQSVAPLNVAEHAEAEKRARAKRAESPAGLRVCVAND
jgi:hypothetical protein